MITTKRMKGQKKDAGNKSSLDIDEMIVSEHLKIHSAKAF